MTRKTEVGGVMECGRKQGQCTFDESTYIFTVIIPL